MPFPLLLAIDPPRVSLTETLHNSRKGDIRHLYGQMDMVGHQTKSMDAVAKLLAPLLKQTIKISSVLLFKENILPGIPPEEDMVNSPRIEKAWLSSHGIILMKLLKLSSLTPFWLEAALRKDPCLRETFQRLSEVLMSKPSQ
jgi:hypothetical protein